MGKLSKYLFIGAILCLAIVSAFTGSPKAAMAFVTAWVLLEIILFLGLFNSTYKANDTDQK